MCKRNEKYQLSIEMQLSARGIQSSTQISRSEDYAEMEESRKRELCNTFGSFWFPARLCRELSISWRGGAFPLFAALVLRPLAALRASLSPFPFCFAARFRWLPGHLSEKLDRRAVSGPRRASSPTFSSWIYEQRQTTFILSRCDFGNCQFYWLSVFTLAKLCCYSLLLTTVLINFYLGTCCIACNCSADVLTSCERFVPRIPTFPQVSSMFKRVTSLLTS